MKKIKKVNELIDKDVLNKLNVKKFDRSKYFFSHKEINHFYDAHIFEIFVKDMNLDAGGKAVLINLLVTYKFKDYVVGILYMDDENVFYIDLTDEELGISDLRQDMGESNMEIFNDVTEQIINELIPVDFWEIRLRES
jgi:uncharacterized Fe-S center protein